ncbi:hypothetical protein [Microvirga flavescens]|uniref:hypothetical protein n=1 Tax=Microvirga flavescens TaxID=2249811 RepID=UPI00130044AD|nr:hypothetical protein [Microvirga flavescens]
MEPVSIVITLLMIASSTPAKAGTIRQPIDLSNVSAVAITGNASSIRLTTDEGPYQATLAGRHSGWFARWSSSWFPNECRTSSRMWVDGSTLFVEADSSQWLDTSDCVVEIKANVRKETAVSIEQAASQARLSGDFSSIALDNKAADISFDGHARNVSVRGGAIKARFSFDEIRQNETITVDAYALDVLLGFGRTTPISYTVEAKASLVDSSLANSPGAKPSVSIKSDYARVRIR